jgi:hypothetical protein
MNVRVRLLIALIFLSASTSVYCLSQQTLPARSSESAQDTRDLLLKIGKFSPDPCGPPYEIDQDTSHLEASIFDKVTESVIQALNTSSGAPVAPRKRAEEALARLERISAETDLSWPPETRLQLQILDILPALVLKATIRTDARFFVFGIPEEDSGKPNRLWRLIGSDEESVVPRLDLELYPLRQSPGGNPRFLAKFIRSGCAGSVGVAYDAREWDPKGNGSLEQIIKLSGAFGLDDKVPGFEQIGTLHTEDSMITLPFCTFTAIDTWDNPSLCAEDTYDVSGDEVRFQARRYNRPDLVPIAKALEYAEKRDYPAVLAYCASEQVAHSLVSRVPPSVIAEDLTVTHTGTGEEHVEFGSEGAYRFEVAQRNGWWVIVGFTSE